MKNSIRLIVVYGIVGAAALSLGEVKATELPGITEVSDTEYRVATRALVDFGDQDPDVAEEGHKKQVTLVPASAPWVEGTLRADPRHLDLICQGQGEFMESNVLDLNAKPAMEIPDLFALDNDGNLIFAEPKPMGTIGVPKGYQPMWGKISLTAVKSKENEDARRFLCLGIKPTNSVDCVDQLYKTDNDDSSHPAEYVALSDENNISLVPLLSTTDLSGEGRKYTPAEVGSKVSDCPSFPHTSKINFSSVYRLNIGGYTNCLWEKNTLAIPGTDSNKNINWTNFGRLGIGPVNVNGQVLENQLVAINYYGGEMIYSSDGKTWHSAGTVTGGGDGSGGYSAIVYGNNRWCTATSSGMSFLVDQAQTWYELGSISLISALAFGNGTFMVVSYGTFYTLSDGDSEWVTISAPSAENDITILGYSSSGWICGDTTRKMFRYDSENEKWDSISIDETATQGGSWRGSCFNDCFYVINDTDGTIEKSADNGRTWTKLGQLLGGTYYNVTLYKDKLYALNEEGTACYVGNPADIAVKTGNIHHDPANVIIETED